MSEAGDRIRERFPDGVVGGHEQHGDETLEVTREALVPILAFAKGELGFRLPLDVTCVDLLGMAPGRPEDRTPPLHPMYHHPTVPPLGRVEGPRFEVLYHVRRLADGALLRLKVRVDEADPTVPTATAAYRGLEWFEREVFDMFGIRFEGHPDLRRILLYPEFVGHPLRKDYPRRGYQPLVDMPRLQGDPVPGLEK